MAGVIVIFDFDSTIIEMDSDNWVLDHFGLTEKFYQLLPNTLWNPLMNKMMNELHSQGKNIEEIIELVKRTPIHPRIVPAIQAAYSLGCELRIVSDANIFFIETILKHHGVLNCFSKITANPSYVNEDGRLIICPYHDYLKSSHGCNLCPPNMCKGLVIEKFQSSLDEEGEKNMIYLGDGSGDFCPSLKLKESDYLMPRMNFALCDLVSKNSNDIKAHVHGWRDGGELENVLLHIINKINIDYGNNIVGPKVMSLDCKMGTISTEALKPFPEAISIPL
ncbi:unnamed protein product [Lathyrus sativus]|nr:unnamed protein product [Lathyrus sativus]